MYTVKTTCENQEEERPLCQGLQLCIDITASNLPRISEVNEKYELTNYYSIKTWLDFCDTEKEVAL